MNAAFTCLKAIYLEKNTISGTIHRTSTFQMIGAHVIVVKLCSSQKLFKYSESACLNFSSGQLGQLGQLKSMIVSASNTLPIQGARIQNFSMVFPFEE